MPGRVQLVEQRRGENPDRPFAIGERRFQRLDRLRCPVGRQRIERVGAGGVGHVGKRHFVGLTQHIRAPRWFHLADQLRHRSAHRKVQVLGPRQQQLRGVGYFQPDKRPQHSRLHPLVFVGEHSSQAVDRDVCRQSAEDIGERSPHGPVRIGIQARQDDDEGVLVDGRRRAQRRDAHDRPRIGDQVLHDRQGICPFQRPQRRHCLETEVRIGLDVRRDPPERYDRVGETDVTERADRGHCDLERVFAVDERQQRRTVGGILQSSEPSRCEGDRVLARTL